VWIVTFFEGDGDLAHLHGALGRLLALLDGHERRVLAQHAARQRDAHCLGHQARLTSALDISARIVQIAPAIIDAPVVLCQKTKCC
jgi:hypothetical protein